MTSSVWLFSLFATMVGESASAISTASKPNVIIVMVDDMGFGDLSCHGSPHAKTRSIDRLHETSVRLTDFHVAPMCSPTRGQLMTGIDAMRNGSTIVASSRMMVRSEWPMMPAHFAESGYATAQFGKWHLGENHPHRPQDRGFQKSIWFPLQEISSFSDYWQNDYFDPTLWHNGTRQRFEGYCTDIFFREAIAWMTLQQEAKKPFLCYLPLNVCHGPQWSPVEHRERIRREFPNLSAGQVGYLAMLANADDNIGKLDEFLSRSGLVENTIVVFLSDNGGYALIGHYNANMRDGKSRLTEGGHRVPCFLRWPAGAIGGENNARDLSELTQVQDILPTLLDLCGVKPITKVPFDGISLAGALRGNETLPDRTLVVQYGEPKPFHMTCVMQGRWRLLTDIKGSAKGQAELYDLERDPMQRDNLIAKEPARAKTMRDAYDRWWQRVESQTRKSAYISLGHPDANPTILNSAEWSENAMGGIAGLRSGRKRHGVWDVEIAQVGTYEVELYRWPVESGLGITQGAPAWTPRDTSVPDHAGFPAGLALPIANAKLCIGEQVHEVQVRDADKSAGFRLELPTGKTTLEAWFTGADGKPVCGAFFVAVTRVP